MADAITLLERQYKNAIDARDKLNDNYHKWMTYYYVANAAILVSITTLYGKCNTSGVIFFLSLLGLLICILWNLSCKGYYYWSKSWIDIIINLEKKVTNDEQDKFVYGSFSQNVVGLEKHSWHPIKPANISTPKLTLLFSFVSIISWTVVLVYEFLTQHTSPYLYCNIISSVTIILFCEEISAL